MDLQLVGKRCLITGATSGIGAGVARVLAQEGARIAMIGRNAPRLEESADSIQTECGSRPTVLTADLTEASSVLRVAGEAMREFGGVDVLVNNAGGSRPVTLDASEADWDEALDLNFSAARRLTQALLPGMLAHHWGRIISVSGSMEPRSLNAAVAAKGALHLWSKGLSGDVAARGVTVNCVAPGRINSDQILNRLHPDPHARAAFIEQNIPAGHFGEPEDVGRLVAFLASPLAGYITGTVIAIDGGMHHFAH